MLGHYKTIRYLCYNLFKIVDIIEYEDVRLTRKPINMPKHRVMT